MDLRAPSLAILLILLGAAGALASTHDSYSQPRAGFSATDTDVQVDDTAVYKTGYYSANGSEWTAFNMTGPKQIRDWVVGGAQAQLELDSIRYVAVYSCTYNDVWDCSETWQVRDRGAAATCGNGVVDPGEECDGANVPGCQELGYESGTTSCSQSCDVITSACEETPGTPVIYTTNAGDLTTSSASLRADVYDMGTDDTVDVWFEWRRAGTSEWTQTAEETIDDGRVTPRQISGLEPDTEYEYRAHARAEPGAVQSETQTLRTHKQVTSGSVSADHAVLMDFYQATGGDSWDNNDGWGGDPETMGSWHGVTTYSSGPDTGRVKEIRLKDNNLVGEIPESFGDLSKLTHLRVKGNSLTGPIDTFICDLESARWLSFSSFTSVNGQQDRDIDDYVRFNHEGKNGDGQNGFTGSLPECIQDMTSLRMLEVAASHLSGELPARLPPNINALFIQSNDMSGPLPPAWGEASALTHLYINQNFRDAKYTGPIPPEWNGMKEMRWLTAKGNEFTGPLPVMDQWYDVRLFAIGGPPIGGEFPFWLMTDPNKHRSLHTMEIGGTRFTGQLPQQISPYFDPSTFSIMNNDLTGPIPQWFEEQFRGTVQILWSGNSFSGEFPDVSDFSDLRFIEVAGNEFTGSLPEVDPNNPTLNIVTFSNNNFNGTIPNSWGQLADGMFYRGMRIQNNEVEGPIPTRLGEIVKNRFHTENNKFVFADLIPVVQEMRSHSDFEDPRGVNYAPQKPFGHARTVERASGDTFTHDFSDKSHPDDSYQWTKDGQPIPGETGPSITITDLQASDAGEYRLEISNPFGDVEDGDGQTLGTLVSEPITVEVADDGLSDEVLPGSTLVATEQGNIHLAEVANGLSHPWAMDFLPDGRILVTERTGTIRIVSTDGTVSAPLDGPSDVHVAGQGGLLDIALHPDYESNGWVYVTYAAEQGSNDYMTHLARAEFDGSSFGTWQTLFEANGANSQTKHYGSRIAFDDENHVYFGIGDRGSSNRAQDLDDHAGSIIRLNDDGSVPADNPFVGQSGAQPEIYAYGVRNPQGLTTNPYTGEIWEQEHGPKGGDEVNIIRAGENYGWPLYTEGVAYSGDPIGSQTPPDGTTEAVYFWDPSIAPSGLTFYTGDKLAPWKGDLLHNALKYELIERHELSGEEVMHTERFLEGELERIRSIAQGPDEYLYVLQDGENHGLYRLGPFEQ